MYTFVLQTVNKDIVFDFSFHLKEAVKYNNWFFDRKTFELFMDYELENDILIDNKFFIPIGSVEYVLEYYKNNFGIKNIEPINIPRELKKHEFLKRRIFTGDKKEEIISLPTDRYFIKDISKIKGSTDIVTFLEIPNSKNILASEEIKIQSEWRCFVFNGELLDIRGYLINYFSFPNVDEIRKMIRSYKNSPKAYTLDVAVTEEGDTVLIEVHDFFSCGLYGFMDYKVLPYMYVETHKKIIKEMSNLLSI